jgi:hypothetical protein
MTIMRKKALIKVAKSEVWKELDLKKGVTRKRYAISNHGRIASFKTRIEEGYILKPRLTQGYPSVTVGRESNRQNYYLHRLVAKYFTRQLTVEHNYVIHIDHSKENNKAENLRWVKHEQQIRHALHDPKVLKRQSPDIGHKLNVAKVKQIKLALSLKNSPTLKVLAKQFKVSDMQIHRIKTGENWSHI